MSEREIAIEMYKNEHTRWNQWAVFFFGSIVSLFVLYDKIQSFIPLWIPLSIGCILSIIWIFVALSIRMSTRSWDYTIRALEKNKDIRKAFELFTMYNEHFSRWCDFRRTMQLWKKEPYLRVTRIVTLFGVLSAACFLILAILSCLSDTVLLECVIFP
jgi:hypothetical protein